MATSRAAATLHLHVGSRLPVGIWAPRARGGLPPFYRKLDLTVTGIGVVSTQVVQDDIDSERTGFLIGTPALDREFTPLLRRPRPTSACGWPAADTTRPSARNTMNLTTTSPYFADGAAQLLQLLEVYDTSAIEAEAQRAIRPEAIALGVFGIIAALAALIIGAQSISRQLRAAGDDAGILRALGAGPAAATADGVLGILAAVVAGALLAVAIAIGLSPFSLFGPVRQVEPGRGVYLDWTVLALGALGLILVLGGVAAVIGYRQAPHRAAARQRPAGRGSAVVRAGARRRPGRRGRGGPAVRAGAGAAAGPPCRSGRCSPERCWPSSWSPRRSRSAPASATSSPARPCTDGTSTTRCTRPTDGDRSRRHITTPLLRRDRLVAASTGVYFLTVQVDEQQTVPAILSPTRPAVGPRILSGHGLDGPGQIVLGPATLAQLHKQVGDQVTVQLGPVIRDARLRIVGTAALPALGDTLGIHPSLSTGAILPTGVVTPAALDRGRPGIRSQRHLRAAAARREPGRRPAVAAADHQRVQQDRALAADRG